MRPYAVQESPAPELCKKALSDLEAITRFVRELPEAPAPKHWSCHALTRAVQEVLRLRISWTTKDGYYHRLHGHRHSWLLYQGPRISFLLDVDPVAALSGPALFDVGYSLSPHMRQFHEAIFPNDDLKLFEREKNQLIRAHRSQLVQHG